MALNRFSIIGRLTCPPILKTNFGDELVAILEIIVNRRIRQGDATPQRTDFLRVTAAGRHADTAMKYLSTGSSVYVEGRLEACESADDRREPHGLDLVAERIEYLSAVRIPSRQPDNTVVNADDYRHRRRPGKTDE